MAAKSDIHSPMVFPAIDIQQNSIMEYSCKLQQYRSGIIMGISHYVSSSFAFTKRTGKIGPLFGISLQVA